MSAQRLPLYALVAANAISILGNVVSAIALPWLVLITTGSAAKTGLTAFMIAIPFATAGLFGGALSDRIGAWRTSVFGDSLSAAAVATIPFLHALDRLEFWHVLVLAFLKSAFDAPGTAARRALLPELADRANLTLEGANSLYVSTEHIGYVTGAPLAGVAIAAIGGANVLWIDAASFAFAAAIVLVNVPAGRRVASTGAGYLRDVRDGLRFARREPAVGGYFLQATFGNFLAAWIAPVILPVYARVVFDSSTRLGVMVGIYGLGGILGTILFGAAATRIARRAVYLIPRLAYPMLVLALVPLPRFGLVLIPLFLFGLAVGLLVPLHQTVIHERTPEALQGRIFGIFVAMTTAAGSIGMLVAGVLIDSIGLRAVLLVLAAGFALLLVTGLLHLRRAGDAYPKRAGGQLETA
jgi:predicted MFS family arabinose efflux permease